MCDFNPKHSTANTKLVYLFLSVTFIGNCGSWYRLGVLFHKQLQYKKGWLFQEGSISTKREPVSFRNLATMYWKVGSYCWTRLMDWIWEVWACEPHSLQCL